LLHKRALLLCADYASWELLVQHRFATFFRKLLVSGNLAQAHAIAPLLFRIIQRRVRAYDNLFSTFTRLKLILFSELKAFIRSVMVTLPSSRCVFPSNGKSGSNDRRL